MEENKKSKLGIGILIGVLITLVIGLTGYIVYDKVLTNNNEPDKTQTDNSEKIINLELSSSLVTSLSKTFYGKYLNSEVSIYENYFYKQNKTVISNVPDQLKMIMTFKYLDNPEKVSISEYEIAYRQIFGSSSTPVKLNRTNDCETDYELVNDYYQHPEGGGCGGASGGLTYSKLIGAKLVKNNQKETIVISETVAFMVNDKLYKDVNHTEFVQDYEYVSNKNPLDSIDTSKFAQYDYTFVKDANGIYVFTSVERVK